MKKIRKIFYGLLLSSTLLLSVPLSVSAANTQDRREKFEWTKDAEKDVTPLEYKEDGSGVYFKVVNGTLPANGFYVRAVFLEYLPNQLEKYSLTEWFLVKDYRKYVINSNLPDTKGLFVGLVGRYPAEWGYTWGNVTIDWSADYQPESGVVSLKLPINEVKYYDN